MGTVPERTLWVGVSLKMYFSHARAASWCAQIAEIARTHPATAGPDAPVKLFVIPSFPSIPAALAVAGDAVLVGGQDLATEDVGAYTGEVSGAELAELGCRVVEVGHAERRRLFGETEDVVAAKTLAALRNRLAPVLCIGEADVADPEAAAAECIRQIDSALSLARESGIGGQIIVAYEPHWAIGAAIPASDEHIRRVCMLIRAHLDASSDLSQAAIIYGGSAGPGLLTSIGDSVDGVFLGRFAHDASAVRSVLDEALALPAAGSPRAAF
ncbi:triose-phosphate isomerase family protein [Psychromicrobium xiongbiense]|uniref:triose-phosphate isomerase family protein n=1 Tax=Psychromicrobium xiongbiense TaxID=3051184 RepID=UPI002553EEDD|nr:triose-phosphate isomerase family protein [Psychromicrobium sp. YIM S02556]